ncbi:MAG: DUF1080 domain-containing protein [Phycisphaeraceae bacterium]|nr:DUF1080 domain-containing protein [Phycisphaeraceae bacterium]
MCKLIQGWLVVIAASLLPAGCASKCSSCDVEKTDAAMCVKCAENNTCVAAPNTLCDGEKEAGWQLLFDGRTLDGWHNFKKPGEPVAGWEVQDGCIVRTAKSGDLVTDQVFGDFELQIDWKIPEGGNSGIFYRFDEKHDRVYDTGPEYQVLDNTKHNDGKSTSTSAGSNYALVAPVRDVTNPVGEFNHARIIVRGDHVEHYMNSVKLLEYEMGSDEWKQLVAASKFAEMPDYGSLSEGHIGLQDHGGPVWYRNIKIRKLD